MATKRFQELRRNKFYLFWCRFFVDLNALNAVLQLFYLQRGLDLPQILYLGVVWSLISLIFEIPTSYLADHWGRKNMIVVGVILNIIGNGIYFFSFGFWVFALQAALMSMSFSCFSGVEDAFLYDTLKEMGQEDVILKTSGKYLTASRLAKMFTPFIGAMIVKDLLASQFNVVLLINFLSSFVAIAFALSLTEPKVITEVTKKHVNILSDGWALLRQDGIFRKFAFNKTLVFISSFIFWKMYQGYLKDMGLSVLMLGLFYPIFNSIYIFIFMTAEKISKKVPGQLIFGIPGIVVIIGSLILLVTRNLWVSYAVSVLLISVGTVRDPFFTQQVQWRIASHNRATATSMFYYLKSILDIPLLFLSGYLAFFGISYVFIMMIAMGLLVITFFNIRKKDLLISYN